MMAMMMMMMMMMMMSDIVSDTVRTGSPFHCNVIDPSSVVVAWESIRLCSASQPAQLDLDLNEMSPSDLDVTVTGL